MEYDVVVVGAGPAGSSAAFHLAKAGERVLILEKDREVGRNILCAEGASRAFLEMVKPEKGVANEIRKIRIKVEDTIDFEVFSTKPFGYILERRIFDRMLFERAVESGAIPLMGARFVDLKREDTGCRIIAQVKGKEVEFMTDWVVGADGPGSGVGQKAGLKSGMKRNITHHCSQVFLYHPDIRANTIVFYYLSEITPGGYAWVFPKSNGFANVGLGVNTSWEDAERNLEVFLQRYYPAGKILGYLKGVVPSATIDNKHAVDNVLLTGDAGRLADPMSGGGIANAYISGELAAHSILEKNQDLYDTLLKKRLGRDHEISWIVRRVFYSLSYDERILIFSDLQDSLNGRDIGEIDAVSALKLVLKVSPRLVSMLFNKGGKAVYEFVREVIS